jgi:uncharacterized protein (DUF2252 family)
VDTAPRPAGLEAGPLATAGEEARTACEASNTQSKQAGKNFISIPEAKNARGASRLAQCSFHALCRRAAFSVFLRA